MTDHQALQPLLKRNRAHKQYSSRLTRWLDRLSHFDVNVQYTAGKNIPLTDYLSRHPIIHEHETETPHEGDESEAEEEFVINQIYGLFEFNRTNGSITQHMRRPPLVKNSDQSERRTQVRKQNNCEHSIQTFSPQKDIDSPNNSNFDSQAPKMSKMDRVNGIDLQFIFKNGDTPQKLAAYGLNDLNFSNRIEPELWEKARTTSRYWNIVLRNKIEKKLRN